MLSDSTPAYYLAVIVVDTAPEEQQKITRGGGVSLQRPTVEVIEQLLFRRRSADDVVHSDNLIETCSYISHPCCSPTSSASFPLALIRGFRSALKGRGATRATWRPIER